jgi:hypothetical protein
VRASNVPSRLGRDLERWATLVVESDDQIVGLGALDHDVVKRVYIDPARGVSILGRVLRVAGIRARRRRPVGHRCVIASRPTLAAWDF